jgi:two-component system chemotaxis response regulator CheY
LARKILLADDSVTAQNMGRKILADAGYEVLTVNNGSAALKKIAEAKPEIIILDVYMPGYSGLEVCQRLKEAQETSRIPVLLTVGKLEPFKPEEAKRVRADGYIVKPFEASELLSALSKLEDKIVPRPEAAKPGRFARANAAIDESRYDKSVAVDEDSGWKNRIAFPPKKKGSTEPEDGDDPAIYNALNKDLRTVVEHKTVEHKPVDHKPAEKPHEAKPETSRVNLEALAPEGLPKDVTPEEIAALAAAAAQVKGKIAESKIAEFGPGHADSHADSAVLESKPIETTTDEATIKTSGSTQAKEPESVDASKVFDVIAVPAPVEQKPEDKIESPTERPVDSTHEAPREIAPSSTDVMAAIAALETSASTVHSGNGFRRRSSDEPVTMAMAAGAEYAVAARWRAVPVALESDEIPSCLGDCRSFASSCGADGSTRTNVVRSVFAG